MEPPTESSNKPPKSSQLILSEATMEIKAEKMVCPQMTAEQVLEKQTIQNPCGKIPCHKDYG